MRLTTSGIPNTRLATPLVGKVSRKPVPIEERADRILVTENVPSDIAGYAALLTGARVEALETLPVIQCIRETDHLRTDDIVAIEPRNGFVRTLYRPDSDYNIIFATQRCNSNCLMCSQPPQDRDDTDPSVRRNLELIRLIDPPPKRLTMTGGEPTLLGGGLFTIVAALRDKFPSTHLHMLTNGRIFAWSAFTARLAEVRHPDLVLGVPLYSDDSTIHDYVVQARDAFDQTVLGLHQLARHGIRVEIRVVLHAISIPRLHHLAEYIYRNLTFAEHVALMGLEHIGYAPRNMKALWIDPHDCQDELESAVEILSTRGMNVSIYNHQLCVLRKSLWEFARKSISDWKNTYIDECRSCSVRAACGGFFQWPTKFRSRFVHALPETDSTTVVNRD